MLQKIRNTISYRYSVFAGIFTAAVAILYCIEEFSANKPDYSALLPVEILILPAFGMCGIVLLILDLVFKKQLSPAKFNNKFLIAIELILIAGYAFVCGYFILEAFLSCFKPYNYNPAEGLSILGIYFAIGTVLAIIIRFIAFIWQKLLRK